MNQAKLALLFLAKSLTFAIILWATWQVLNRLSTAQRPVQQLSQDANAKYFEQAAAADKQLLLAQDLMRRQEALLGKQEELARRSEAVMAVWERDAKRPMK